MSRTGRLSRVHGAWFLVDRAGAEWDHIASQHRAPGILAAALVALLGLVTPALTGCEALVTLVTPTPIAAPSAAPTWTASAPTASAPTVAATGTPAGQPAPSATRPPATPTRPAGPVIPTPLPGDRFLTISFDRLTPEARDTIRLIARGGPFPYRQDGVVFENRERLLPAKASGYYHEYTVETPGSPDRGARRIITGGQGELYYTSDHYASFKRVVP